MASLNIQNRNNLVKRGLQFLAQFSGLTLTIYPSRYTVTNRTYYSFLNEVISQFPRNISQQFNDAVTTLNFSTGMISGGDQVSPVFVPPTIPSGDAVIAVVSVSTNDVLSVTFSNVLSIAQTTTNFNNNILPLTKVNVPLWGLLIYNGAIQQLADLRPDFSSAVFKYNDINLLSNTQTWFKMNEYLIADAPASSTSLQIRNSLMDSNTAISIISAEGTETATVLNVVRGGQNDIQTLTFSAVPNGGSFVINFGGNLTAPLLFSYAASDIQTQLRYLPNITDTQVTGDFQGGFVFNFTGGDGNTPQPLIIITSNTLVQNANSVTTTVTHTQTGITATNVDQLNLSAPTTYAHTVAGGARVQIQTYYKFSQGLNSRSNILYDSGWQAAAITNLTTLTHNLGLNVMTYSWFVYFNSSQTQNGATMMQMYSDNGLSSTYGVEVISNFNTVQLKFGATALIHTLTNTGAINTAPTSGYFRAVAVAH